MSHCAEAFRYLHLKRNLCVMFYNLAEVKKVLGTSEFHLPE
ncbi:8961_t:CDS:1, partial [Racocetra persica]